MPKTGPSDKEWLKRLHDFAAGTFKFSQGKHPGPNSKWARELKKIKICPLFKNPHGGTIFRRQVPVCLCTYHLRVNSFKYSEFFYRNLSLFIYMKVISGKHYHIV